MTFFYNLNKKLDAIQATTATNKQLNESQLAEKWAGDTKLNPEKKGMFKGKSKAELEKQLAALHKSGPHKKGSPEYTKQQELNFAIRAKSNWKEGVEEGIGDALKTVGSVAKKVGQKALNTLGHGSDADMMRDLQKKMGVPQTGQKPQQQPPVAEGDLEGYDTGEDYNAKAQWLIRTQHMRPDEAKEMAYYDTDPATWIGSPWEAEYSQGVAEGYQEPTDAAGHAKMAAKIKKMLDDTLADRGHRHGNPDPHQLARAHEYHTQKAKEKSHGVGEARVSRKTPNNKPVNPKDLVISLDQAVDPKTGRLGKGPRGSKQYDPSKDFPGAKIFQKEGVNKAAFAKLAPPKDKITFADKIVGAKKEVDEMLGDVAAEAMKNALRGGQKKLDRNKNGKIDGQDFAMMRGGKQETDESWDDMLKDVKKRRASKVGSVTHGAKHDIEHTATGRKVTRRTDPNTGYSVGSETDDEGNVKTKEKRTKAGRPETKNKKPERVTAKATKHKGGRKTTEDFGPMEEGADEGNDLVKLSKVIASCKTREQLLAAQKMANNFLSKHLNQGMSNIGKNVRRRADVDDTLQQKNRELKGEVEEEAVSGNQAVAARIARGVQKGEVKAKKGSASAEMAKMKPNELKKFAKTDTTGLPKKVSKKKEKTEESGESSGSKGGMSYGKGIYDSFNRELEGMISESFNVSVNMSVGEDGEPKKNISINADGDDAIKLAELLNLAGVQMPAQEEHVCGGCGMAESQCACDHTELDENSPDWPTQSEVTGATDPHQERWSGGLNRPKATGQTTIPVVASQLERQHAYEAKQLGTALYKELKLFKG